MANKETEKAIEIKTTNKSFSMKADNTKQEIAENVDVTVSSNGKMTLKNGSRSIDIDVYTLREINGYKNHAIDDLTLGERIEKTEARLKKMKERVAGIKKK